MSTDPRYHQLDSEERGLNEEEISNILRNPTEQPDESRRINRRKRILTILAVLALLALVAIGFYAASRPPTRGVMDSVNIANDSRLEPYRDLESATECPDWPVIDDEHEPRRASIAFEFPSTFDLLFVLSQGETAGNINVLRSDGYSPSGNIEVNVTAEYDNRANLKRTKVCRTGQESKNEHGVLIWAAPLQQHTIKFNITILVPRSQKPYKDFSTDLPFFSHQIGDFFDIWSPTVFKDIRLKSWNAPIDYGSLVGEAAYIQTNNAKVLGFFAGPRSVNVFTTNAAIQSVSIMLGSTLEVNLRTSNAPIAAFLNIISDHDETNLTATVHTTNGALNVTTMPKYLGGANPSFFLEASTSNAPALLSLHPIYEGTYDLETSFPRRSRVEVDTKTTDPSGKGRRRIVERMSTGLDWRRHAKGAVFWSDDGQRQPPLPGGLRRRGSISVQNSGAPITLYC